MHSPSGQYPLDTPLADVIMSGRTPQWSTPNQRPVRPNPVITSSMISSTPWRRSTSVTAGQ
jgi:hypothetical protein